MRDFDNKVKVLRKQAEAAVERIETVFSTEVDKAKEELLKALQKDLDAVCKIGSYL